MDLALLQSLAIATGLGLLVGLQREWRSERPAGIRTFTLITVLGTLCAAASEHGGGWIVAAGLLAVAANLWLGDWMATRDTGDRNVGITTEIAALVMFLVGVMLGYGLTETAIVVTGVTAVLLHWKAPLHAFAHRIGENEFRAIIQFVLIALVLLPIVPNQPYGPYQVLNPFKIWLMVTFIVGINLVSYVFHRALSANKGAIVGGILGGMISSTATTVSHARQSKGSRMAPRTAVLVIVVASAMVNVRVLIEIAVIGPGLLKHAIPPFVILGLFMFACIAYLMRRDTDAGPTDLEPRNPAEVKTAVLFGALFAVVIFIVAAVKAQFGVQAVYLVAFISGLTDIDAMTLSAADLFHSDRLDASDAWRVVMVASLSNLLFKAGITAMFAAREVSVVVAAVFGLTAVAGIALVLWWPAVVLSG